MANFSINNFVIDHAVRANMVNTDTGEIMWSINPRSQIQSLHVVLRLLKLRMLWARLL